jgi:hypothetical protein
MKIGEALGKDFSKTGKRGLHIIFLWVPPKIRTNGELTSTIVTSLGLQFGELSHQPHHLSLSKASGLLFLSLSVC